MNISLGKNFIIIKNLLLLENLSVKGLHRSRESFGEFDVALGGCVLAPM